jgi:4-amino-4-deoxy-L-arabinose transferase-like glycosyltransferase
MTRSPWSRLWALLGSCALLFLLGFSPWGLWERDEGRYADVARQMLSRRDFITPRINGVVFLDKPPLVYWMTAASMAIWGAGDAGARFGQTVFAAGLLLVTRRLGILLFDRRRGNLALIILASSVLFFAASHVLTLDLGLSFFVSLTLLMFLRSTRGGPERRRWGLGMFAAAAGGVLAKGPIGALLPALTIACFLVLRKEWRRARDLPWVPGVLLFLVIVIPWFAAVSMANPGFLSYFFVHEHFERFTTTVHRHEGAWYYYLAIGALGFLPWTLLIPVRIMGRLTRPAAGGVAGPPFEARAFLWSWLLPGLLFFSFAQSKLPLYIVPLLPAAALLLAAALDRELREPAARPSLFWPPILLVAVLGPAAALRHRHLSWEHLDVGGLAVPLCVFVAVVASAGLVLGVLVARRGRPVVGPAVLAVLWMTSLETAAIVASRVNYLNGTRYFATVLGEAMRPGEPVYAYQAYLRGLSFYLQRTVGLISPHSDDLKFGRTHGHDADAFVEEASFLRVLSGDRRAFAVVRTHELRDLQTLVRRPLFILARIDSFDLVSNRLDEERVLSLRGLLQRTGFDLEDAMGRAARAVPGGAIDTIEIERVDGVPLCTLSATLGASPLEARIPMERPDSITLTAHDPAREESGREDFMVRLAFFPREAGDVPRLVRSAAGM